MNIDILGNEVQLGDKVRFMQIKHREFMDGTTMSVANTSALISHEPTNTCSTESRQRYDQMISLSALERSRRADAAPVVRGEWIEAKSGCMSVWPPGQVMCSVCGQRMPSRWKKMPPYCYGCGAKMESEGNT